MESRPPIVPPSAVANPVGDAVGPRAWAEPSVWTERMLTALEHGVKGDSFFAEAGLFSLNAAQKRYVNPL
jgi:hypothetical protein